MILVSGANGKFAGAVIKNLKGILAGKERFAVGTRNMRAIEKGEFNIVSPDYESITGRPARTLRQFFKEYRKANL